MNKMRILADFFLTFVVVLLVSSIVTFTYSWIAHGDGVVDWGTAFQLAFIFGIVIPWINRHGKRDK